MKRFVAILAMLFMIAVAMPIAASANSGGNKSRKSYNSKRIKDKKYRRSYRQARREPVRRDYRDDRRYDQRRDYRDSRDRRSVYQRKRNVINIGIGAGAGAIVGGILGGKKGALIGAGVGAGAAAAYTYGINPKNKRPRRVNRNRRY